MATSNIRIALAQINSCVGDFKKNTEKIIDYIKLAQNKGANLVVFPELAITGYPPEDLLLKNYFIDSNNKAIDIIKKQVSDIVVIVGGLHKVKKDLFNSAYIISNHKIIDVYHKILLPNYGVFDEKRYFTPGNSLMVYKINNTIFGINICEDIWHENSPSGTQVHEGKASIILVLNSSPYHAGKWLLRKKILSSRAKNLSCYIAYVNLVGGQDELIFDGNSMFISSEGKIIQSGKQFVEELIIGDCNLPDTSNKSKNFINIPTSLSQKSEVRSQKLEYKKEKQLSPIEEIYKALVLGTNDYVNKNGFKKVVLGLSGGIDSSLTAVIAVDAIGRENVTGIFMPSQYSSKESSDDAEILANNLGINYLTIPINSIFEQNLKELKIIFKEMPSDVAEENLQARIRGNVLMALSNKFGWLVLITGNKSEMSVGYATLYGDMAGGLAVLKDVFKTLVYELVEYRNGISNVIPENVIKKAPTAELRPNQKDSDSLPPYNILDQILQAYIEEDKSLNEIIKLGFDENLIQKVIRMVDGSEYKRRQSPPGIKITPRAFGKDRRMPITNRFKL